MEDITIQLFDEEEVLHVYLLEKEREAAARGEKLALSEASSRARTRLLFVCFNEGRTLLRWQSWRHLDRQG